MDVFDGHFLLARFPLQLLHSLELFVEQAHETSSPKHVPIDAIYGLIAMHRLRHTPKRGIVSGYHLGGKHRLGRVLCEWRAEWDRCYESVQPVVEQRRSRLVHPDGRRDRQ